MKLGTIVKSYREELGLSIGEFAKRCSLSKGYISMIENGVNPRNQKPISPTLPSLQKLALGMGIDLDDLLQQIDGGQPISLSQQSSDSSVYGRYRIPVVATVACGLPLFSESNIEGYIDWDKDTDSVFAVHAKGDSMEPKIGDGYLVIVDKEAAWEDGDIVVVTVNGNDGCCKRIKKYKDSIALLSLNPAYEPMVFTGQEVQSLPVVVQGKVIQVRWSL